MSTDTLPVIVAVSHALITRKEIQYACMYIYGKSGQLSVVSMGSLRKASGLSVWTAVRKRLQYK